MPKDIEKIPMPDLDTIEPSEVQAFLPDQMVRCEQCLRANPPTRVNCLYCGVVLPITENSLRLQRPGLRRLERWENGINTILLPDTEGGLTAEAARESADLLKLSPEELQRIISTRRPLPLARAASGDEAALVFRRLGELGVITLALPDGDLRLDERQQVRIRSASLNGNILCGYHLTGTAGIALDLSQLVLLVVGRLFVKRVEVKERKSRRAEADIVHASEFFSDEAVLDIYAGPEHPSLRIEAGSFDFSVLGTRKGLVAGENLGTLINLIRERSPQVEVDDLYTTIRQTLEPVWPVEQWTEAGGWHRERPGRYSTSDVTQSSNENQFTRYSRLQYYLKLNPPRGQRK